MGVARSQVQDLRCKIGRARSGVVRLGVVRLGVVRLQVQDLRCKIGRARLRGGSSADINSGGKQARQGLCSLLFFVRYAPCWSGLWRLFLSVNWLAKCVGYARSGCEYGQQFVSRYPWKAIVLPALLIKFVPYFFFFNALHKRDPCD